MRFERPLQIASRRDALQLWLHLIELRISYHWEDDASDWVNIKSGKRTLTREAAAAVNALFDQVNALNNSVIFSDGARIGKIATTLGSEMIELVDPDDVRGSYDRLRREVRRAERRFRAA